MAKKKLYFENEDSAECYPLSMHLIGAMEDELKEIELLEAVPDFKNPDFIWCSEMEIAAERSECNKQCPYYKCVKGRVCDLRGKLYTHGEAVKFNVETGKVIKSE